jgi:AcrR family transcriptional regulator
MIEKTRRERSPAAVPRRPAGKVKARSGRQPAAASVRAPDATRNAILNIAESLFAENGIATTSLRSILLAAGVNVAAAHYHFGSKETLVEEVIRRRAEDLVRARDRALKQAMEVRGSRQRLEAILRAFFEPGLLGGGESREVAYRLAKVRSRLSMENTELSKRIFAKYFNASNRRFVEALVKTCPAMTRKEIYWRYHVMLGAINYTINTPSRIHNLSKGECDPNDLDAALENLVAAMAPSFVV